MWVKPHLRHQGEAESRVTPNFTLSSRRLQTDLANYMPPSPFLRPRHKLPFRRRNRDTWWWEARLISDVTGATIPEAAAARMSEDARGAPGIGLFFVAIVVTTRLRNMTWRRGETRKSHVSEEEDGVARVNERGEC
ncbi:hypothetical protein E2C01_006708 [Portunus trituberculatus]|uniref:Uncharacterized protein n=1 Tax=Portunus trituberculatus TaxID=210409 RepID=A0A5B7D0E1_PORTR|nr:hypothetical protein [Portunus trituberculatus]